MYIGVDIGTTPPLSAATRKHQMLMTRDAPYSSTHLLCRLTRRPER